LKSQYTPELGRQICDLIADGMPLRQVQDVVGFDRWTIANWAKKHEKFGLMYEEAYRMQQDMHVEGCEELLVKAGASKSHFRLRVAEAICNQRRWKAERINRNRYGNQQKVEHSGPDGGAVPHKIEVVFVTPEGKS
jgi:hypothetical protein